MSDAKEARFAERFGAVVLAQGWHCLPAGASSEYGWKDPSWVPESPWESYGIRQAAHLETLHQLIDWQKLKESDFEIGWWTKFLGTVAGCERTQLIKVTFPLIRRCRKQRKILWAAELTLLEAISAVCSDITFTDKY